MSIAADSTADQAPNPAPGEAADEAVKAPAHPDPGESNAEAADEEYEEELDGPEAEAAEREKVDTVFQRLSDTPIGIRVHDVIIQGNTKTRDALIEAEAVDLIRSAATVQDLVRAASIANARLRHLEVFDSVRITLDAGPPELPGTTNVLIEVVEAANPINASVGLLSRPEVSEHSKLLK
jgi:outer membrane protein insertion porin family